MTENSNNIHKIARSIEAGEEKAMASARDRAILTAREWMVADPLFLDTETTGLDGNAEICDVAVIDSRGDVILNTLIRPSKPIPEETSRLHHITTEMVANAPTFGLVWPIIRHLIDSHPVITYNGAYDARIIHQCAIWADRDCNYSDFKPPVFDCAMLEYARFRGEWNDYRGDFRWQKLQDAVTQCGLTWHTGSAHRALYDAQMARKVVVFMAGQKTEEE